MSNNQIASICFISVCALISAITQHPGAFICLAVSISLFGFILWLDRNRIDRVDEIQSQIKELKEKIELIQISRITR